MKVVLADNLIHHFTCINWQSEVHTKFNFFASLAAGSFLVAVIAAPVALITGMIALGKSHMASRESRAAAIIGVVLGGVVIAVIAFYALLFSSLSNSFD